MAEQTDHSGNVSGALTRLSLNRRITVLVLFLTILVVGVISFIGIPLELIPRGFEGQGLMVHVPWRNAPARESLEKITLPLEEELSTVRGLASINTRSSTSGSRAFLRFKRGTDLDVAYREVRDRVERARPLFPEDVDHVFIFKQDVSGIPVSAIGLAFDPGLTDTYNLVKQEVIRPLERIDGVASVGADGLEEKEIIIEVDKEHAEANGLNIYELAQELGGDNFTMASGNVRESGKKYLLRSVANYKSLEELENRLLSPTVRLKDVAEIKYEEAEKRYSVRVNSKPAVAAFVLKEGEANTVALCRKIQATFDEMKDNPRLASVEMEMIFDQGTVVTDSLGNLLNGGRLGGIFAALVLFLFLRRVRLTIIITLSIPLSILMALIAMYFFGETLNLLTMLGLVICVGLLVDNSVVVAENIHRLHQTGLNRRDACIQGAGEIALAVTLATLTTVVVFLPAALLEGELQFFLLRLALPISVALVASLLVALIFIPLSVYLTLPRQKNTQETSHLGWLKTRFFSLLTALYHATFDRLNTWYNQGLAFFLRRRLDMVLLLAGAFALTWSVAFKEIEFAPQQEEDQTSFEINIFFSNEHKYEDVVEYISEAEKILEGKKEQYGLYGYMAYHRTRFGQIQCWFDDDKPMTMTAKEASDDLAKALPEKPGVWLRYRSQNESKDEKKKDIYNVRLLGEDSDLLKDLADDLEPLFLKVQGVIGARMDEELSPSELGMVIDRDQATSSQVNPEWIAGVIGYALRGQSLPKYSDEGREIPVRIRYAEEDRESLLELGDFKVPTQDGELMAISSLTEPRMMKAPRGISRRNKRVSHTMVFELDKETAKETRKRLQELQSQLDLPEGVTFAGAVNFNPMEDFEGIGLAIPLSILFIYLLMGFLFESFILPFSIILTIPLASIGVAWIHYLTGKDLDVLGSVGSILLIGVVVNNGIVLIDYVNRLRNRGHERTEALLLATQRRFRPIIMTALTTIIGMIPLALSEPNRMGMSYKSFGLTLIGGMTTASILTLLVVPIFYTFFDDARQAVSRVMRRAMPPKASEAGDPGMQEIQGK